jgi:hypothetical protein
MQMNHNNPETCPTNSAAHLVPISYPSPLFETRIIFHSPVESTSLVLLVVLLDQRLRLARFGGPLLILSWPPSVLEKVSGAVWDVAVVRWVTVRGDATTQHGVWNLLDNSRMVCWEVLDVDVVVDDRELEEALNGVWLITSVLGDDNGPCLVVHADRSEVVNAVPLVGGATFRKSESERSRVWIDCDNLERTVDIHETLIEIFAVQPCMVVPDPGHKVVDFDTDVAENCVVRTVTLFASPLRELLLLPPPWGQDEVGTGRMDGNDFTLLVENDHVPTSRLN